MGGRGLAVSIHKDKAIPLAIGRADDVLSVLSHSSEDPWDCCASVLGFSVWRAFVWRRSRDADRPSVRVRIHIERRGIRSYECWAVAMDVAVRDRTDGS